MLKKILLMTVLLSTLSAKASGTDDEMLEQFLSLDKEEQKVILSTLLRDKERIIQNTSNDDKPTLGILHTGSGSGGPHICRIFSDVYSDDDKPTLGILHTGSGSGGPNIICPTLDEFLSLNK
jgi:hypothetical protein